MNPKVCFTLDPPRLEARLLVYCPMDGTHSWTPPVSQVEEMEAEAGEAAYLVRTLDGQVLLVRLAPAFSQIAAHRGVRGRTGSALRRAGRFLHAQRKALAGLLGLLLALLLALGSWLGRFDLTTQYVWLLFIEMLKIYLAK